MNSEVLAYNTKQLELDKEICNLLAVTIDAVYTDAENKIWHAHPVWFLEGNPIVGYSKLKSGIRLLFWSGVEFNEPELKPGSGKFKDASLTFTKPDEIDLKLIKRCLKKGREIQYDYKNIVKKKGKLERLK
ncbi:MAG: DUF1801 domain-containing protein [Bacteroidetes bacterium]|nr:DUF1801 domain-containing protein [Bacteroidota bacterium]MBK9672363.1 DUF1801 domain-containing protein [Bacteroidota bacterium]MBP6414048.1 DUF1801 domain-containing protein [Bacteroidia bacterium]